MDDEEDTYSDPSQEGAAPMTQLAIMQQGYTSQEAHDLAKKLYGELETERKDLGADEDAAAQEQEAAAQEMRQKLVEARQRLLARKASKSELWLAVAAGLASPTSTGSFGETIGNVARNAQEPTKRIHDFRDQQEKEALAYDSEIAGIDNTLATNRAKLAAARRAANARLSEAALRTLSREIKPGAGGAKAPPSKNGKIAADLGYVPGTPEFAAKVAELNAVDQKNAAATAGTDAPEASQADLEEAAHGFGVPLAKVDPFKTLSTKQRNSALLAEQKANEARFAELDPEVGVAKQGMADMDRYVELNRHVDTGAVRGLAPAITDAEQEMDAISARASRKMRQPGEGSTSDYDAKQFKLGTVSRTKSPRANLNIARAYKYAHQNDVDRVAFMHDYATVNGHLRGADAAWREYLNANPIFDPKHPGKMILNPLRKDYQTYFREQLGDKPAEEGEPGEDVTADDNDPGHFPGEDKPAYADGGKVAGLRSLFQVTFNGQPIGAPFTTRARAMGLRERLADKHPGKLFMIDQVARKKSAAAAPAADEYADGGSVDASLSDDDLLALAGDEPAPDEEADNVDHLRMALYSALQGTTLGTADEIKSTYDPEGAAKDRSEYSDYAGSDPMERLTSLSAGLLPLAGLVAPGGGSLPQLVGLGAGSGALFGGTGSEEDRGLNAVKGGGEGAIVGPLAGLTAKYFYNKAGQLVDRLTGKALTPGEEKLVTAANRDQIDLADVSKRLRESDKLSVPEGVVDAGGRRTRALVERAAASGGQDAEVYINDQIAKQHGAQDRVSDQVNRGLAPDEYFAKFDDLQHQLYTNSKPLYDKAYKKHPGVQSKEFMALMDTKDGKKAFAEAMRLMDLEGKPMGKANAAGIVQKPSLEFLDYYKRGLDQLIATEEKGGPTTLGRALRNARKRFVDELDNNAPDYKAAREQYAGDLEVRDALASGREEFRKMTPEEIRRKVSKMSWAEKDAYKTGVSQGLFQQLQAPATDVNSARRIWGSSANREKLKAVFDDPVKFRVFEAAMDREMAMFDRNKQSLSRVEGQRLSNLKKGESILARLDPGMSNTPGMGGISMWNRVWNWLRYPLPMSEKTADSVIQTINRGDPKAFDALMTKLSDAQKRLKVRAKRSGKAAAVAAILAGAAMQPTAPGDQGLEDEDAKMREAAMRRAH